MFMKDIKNHDDIKAQHSGQIIPDGELKCIWMSAGQIAYKLCDYDYNCKFCPFNIAFSDTAEYSTLGDIIAESENKYIEVDILEHIKSSKIDYYTDDEKKYFGELFRFKIMNDFYYYKLHSWVDLSDNKLVITGVDSFISKFLYHIKNIILPHKGSVLLQGQPFCWIFDEHGTVTALSPVSGLVHIINENLINNFSAIHKEPYGSGWIIKIKPFEIGKDINNLFPGKEAAPLFVSHAKQAIDHLLVGHKKKIVRNLSNRITNNRRPQENDLLTEEIFKSFLHIFNSLRMEVN